MNYTRNVSKVFHGDEKCSNECGEFENLMQKSWHKEGTGHHPKIGGV